MIKSKTLYSWSRIARSSLARAGLNVCHSHLQEIFAAGLGFRTYASIPAEYLSTLDRASLAVIDEQKMADRSEQLQAPLTLEVVRDVVMRGMSRTDKDWPFDTPMNLSPDLIGALPIRDKYFAGSYISSWVRLQRRVPNEAIPSFEDASKIFEHWWWDKRIKEQTPDDERVEFWEITGGAYFKVTDDGEHYHRVVLKVGVENLAPNLLGGPKIYNMAISPEAELAEYENFVGFTGQ